ncbi:MAG: lysine exporter LysO family protein [Firmicutes bacterium]|nr:lysine exporter LysO family protein [Bacillota bacterium]
MMILILVVVLAAGFACGRLGALSFLGPYESDIILYTLYVMCFAISISLGAQYREGEGEKLSGKALLYAFGTVAGTLLAAVPMSLFLPVSAKDAMIAASGMGWYSLSTGLVYTYSPSLSVATFVCCVSREILAIFLMPLLIKRFRRPEVVSVGGSATINSCVAAATVSGDNSIVLYGILVGTVISLMVPFLIGFLTGL